MDRTQKELFEEANTLHECPGISMDLEGPVLDNSDNRNFAITSEDGRNMNESHPAMEYPPLYFMLQSYPRLMDPIRSVYAFRWRVSYPLQRKVVLPCKLRQFGLFLTWGEVLILIPFNAVVVTGILYTVAFPSVNATGKIARLALLASLVFAQRNSLVTLLLGMPFDRGMFYHKLAGRLAGLSGLLHTFAYCINPVFRSKYKDDILVGALSSQVTISGSVLVLLFVGITMSSMPQIRQRVFEVFYYLHVLFAAGIVVCAYFHSGKVIPIVALLTWGIDLIIRFIVMSRTRYPRKASLKVISDTVIEVTFSKTKTFAYNPGQFIYLSIPEISWLQWHPFSISSSPSQSLVTLHIRKAGNWTTALFQLASKKSEVEMLLEGPYGNLSVDIMSDRKYKNILLISGGIGSKCNDRTRRRCE